MTFSSKRQPGDDPNVDLKTTLFDVFEGLPRASTCEPTNVTECPFRWERLGRESRFRVSRALIEADPPGVVLGPARRLRARYLPAEQFAETPDVIAALKPYFIHDPQERERWRVAEAEMRAADPLMMRDALRKVTATGDVLATLRARRAELDKAIALAERRLGLTAPATATV